MNARTITGLGILVATLAAPIGAQQPTQVASVKPRTIDAVANIELRQPDQALYDAIGRLDPKKAEEMNAQKKYDEVIDLLSDEFETIRRYDLQALPGEQRAKIAWSANELGGPYLARKKSDIALQWFIFSEQVSPGETLEQRHGGSNVAASKLNMGIAAFNSGKYEIAVDAAQGYLVSRFATGEGSETARKIIDVAKQRIAGN